MKTIMRNKRGTICVLREYHGRLIDLRIQGDWREWHGAFSVL